jgi:hypothetical protein
MTPVGSIAATGGVEAVVKVMETFQVKTYRRAHVVPLLGMLQHRHGESHRIGGIEVVLAAISNHLNQLMFVNALGSDDHCA